MNELPNSVDTDRGRHWFVAIARGVVICIVTAALLTVAVKLCCPHLTDTLVIVLAAIAWIISIGLGIREILKHRPKG